MLYRDYIRFHSLLTTSKFGVGMGFYTGMPYGNGQANGNSCMVWD